MDNYTQLSAHLYNPLCGCKACSDEERSRFQARQRKLYHPTLPSTPAARNAAKQILAAPESKHL